MFHGFLPLIKRGVFLTEDSSLISVSASNLPPFVVNYGQLIKKGQLYCPHVL